MPTIDNNVIQTPATAAPDMVIETSWEVCNKVGGIYTVLSTKAHTLKKMYGDALMFVGPDFAPGTEESTADFKYVPTLKKRLGLDGELPYGVQVRCGRWRVPGNPIAVLVDFRPLFAHKDTFYAQMWERYGVDSLHAYGDYDEGCMFGIAAAIVAGTLVQSQSPSTPLALFNEWTTAMGLLYCKAHYPQIATVFTTHATCMGRSICGNGKPLYDYLKGYNGVQMARELNMEAKHSVESAAARQADSFTTVSEVTARECEQLLERRPAVTPNGFDETLAPVRLGWQRASIAARRRLLDVAYALTAKRFSLENTLVVMTSGRLEYRNKGLDLFLDALARLADMNPGRHILAFVMVPAWTKEPRFDLQRALAHKTRLKLDNPWYTHTVHNPEEDPIMRGMHERGFDNYGHRRVDLIYVPSYLNGNDGIFDMPYYDLLPGIDITVFPSYYEPWGYTPLESVAFGVPTVTTSLSGFGQWVTGEGMQGLERSGVEVVERTDSNYPAVVARIADILAAYSRTGATQRTEVRAAAQATAGRAAWQYFIRYYVDAFAQALDACRARNTAY